MQEDITVTHSNAKFDCYHKLDQIPVVQETFSRYAGVYSDNDLGNYCFSANNLGKFKHLGKHSEEVHKAGLKSPFIRSVKLIFFLKIQPISLHKCKHIPEKLSYLEGINRFIR